MFKLCATDRGTDVQSITLHESQAEAKSQRMQPQWGSDTARDL